MLFFLPAMQVVNSGPYDLATHAQRGPLLIIYRAGRIIPAL